MTKTNEEILQESIEHLQKMKIRSDNRRRGYEPKCKVCNSAYQEEADQLFEKFAYFTTIKKFLEDKGEDVSIMSVSRHYKNHYPKRKEYKDKIEKMEEDAVKNAINIYPELEEILQDYTNEHDFNKPILNENGECVGFEIYKFPNIDRFFQKEGYCLTGYKFCSNIAPRKIKDYHDLVSDINIQLMNLNQSYLSESDKIELLTKKCKCLECRSLNHDFIMDYLLEYMLKNEGINVDKLDAYKFNELYHQEASLDNEEMDLLLQKMKDQQK